VNATPRSSIFSAAGQPWAAGPDAYTSGGLGGTASDIRIQAEQSLHIKSTMQNLIAEHTGQTLEQIEADSDRDRWFTAEQALTYGFIDHVYEAAAQIPSPQAPNQ
jgi:ATP-dependent Clp protease protease subunit